jgi:ABC-type sugar transport system permease subunit
MLPIHAEGDLGCDRPQAFTMSVRESRGRRVAGMLLFLAPALVLLGFVYAYPIVTLVRLSTQRVLNYQLTEPVGLQNFRFVADDPIFRQSLGNSLKLLIAVPILVVLSIIVSSALREQRMGWRLQRALLFLPYILPIPAIGIAFRQILRSDGLFNHGLSAVGSGFIAQDWLSSPRLALWSVLAVIIWKELGLGVLIVLSRLQSVSLELYEAAKLDGAGWWRQLWHVSLPELPAIIALYVVLEAVTMFSWIFAYIFTLTGGGPANTTSVLELYLYRRMFGLGGAGGQNIGAAAAVGVLLLAGLVTCFVLAAVARVVSSRAYKLAS